MEEKKVTNDTKMNVGMTDEEIVKAWKLCLKDKEGCDKCKVYNKNIPMLRERFIVCEKLVQFTYDLIIRLQDEIKEYETVFDIYNQRKYRKMFLEEWKKEYQKELDKQGKGVVAGFPDADYVYQRYFEQKAEIERLTEENKTLLNRSTMWKHLHTKVCEENAELQKQVDEFVDIFGNADNFARMMSYLRIKNGHRITTGRELLEWIKYEKQQAVKDRAKEIFTDLLNEFSIRKSCGNADVVVREMATCKGVEVE